MLGNDFNGQPVYLRDIWPLRSDVQKIEREFVLPTMFSEVYSKISEGNSRWNNLEAPQSVLYPWSSTSTYIKHPPFLETMVNHVMTNCTIYFIIIIRLLIFLLFL